MKHFLLFLIGLLLAGKSLACTCLSVSPIDVAASHADLVVIVEKENDAGGDNYSGFRVKEIIKGDATLAGRLIHIYRDKFECARWPNAKIGVRFVMTLFQIEPQELVFHIDVPGGAFQQIRTQEDWDNYYRELTKVPSFNLMGCSISYVRLSAMMAVRVGEGKDSQIKWMSKGSLIRRLKKSID